METCGKRYERNIKFHVNERNYVLEINVDLMNLLYSNIFATATLLETPTSPDRVYITEVTELCFEASFQLDKCFQRANILIGQTEAIMEIKRRY